MEPYTDAHRAGLAALVRDPDVLRFTRIPDPPPAGFVESWASVYEQGRQKGTREAFAIVDSDDGRFLGIAVVPRIDRESLTAELGYVVAPDARGRGVATAALLLLTGWAFSELGALRLELLIAVDNHASKRVAARSGYVCEGVLRSTYVKPGVRGDSELWSCLPTDLAWTT